MYLMRKEEMELKYFHLAIEIKELLLFHVTTAERGFQSLENGLDWRRTKRSRFGRGVSFSDDADYADFYANFQNSNSEGTKYMYILLYNIDYLLKFGYWMDEKASFFRLYRLSFCEKTKIK